MHAYEVSPTDSVTFRMCVPDSNDPNLAAVRSGDYPQSLSALFSTLLAMVPPPARILDLGGYLGGFGLAAAAAGYDVVIVEANTENVRWIRSSIDQNVFTTPVRLVEAAVGETSGFVSFHANGPWGHVDSNHSGSGTTRVEMMTLPSLLASVGWDALDFIKMDVEGSEGGVLRGAHSWFSAGHRPVVVYEANGHMLRRFGDSPQTLRRFLALLGYYQYELQDDGAMRVPSRFEPRVVVDYVATRTPVSDAFPPRSPWKLMRRTAAALRRNSWPARIHVLHALQDAVVSLRTGDTRST